MKRGHSAESPMIMLAVVLVTLAGWIIAARAGLLASASRVSIFLLANLILSFDVIDLIVRIWLRGLHGATAQGPSVDLGLAEISDVERGLELQPYALLASVHDEAADLDIFLQALQPFKEMTWLIDDASTDSTLLRLRYEGWHCIAGEVNRRKPGALQRLLRALPADIQTVVIMDPDVRWLALAGSERAHLEAIISDLQRSGAAALTPRVQARRGGWLVECQSFEYELACGLGRKSLRDLVCNSGVSIYRRSALQSALDRHSLSVYAEDFENSLLLLAAGERIYYDDRLIAETSAKARWHHLFSQRVGWSFGCVKLLFERLSLFLAISRRSPLGAYQYVVYLLANGIVLLPLKLASMAVLSLAALRAIDELLMTHLLPARPWDEPLLFALWYLKSTLVLMFASCVAVPRGERTRYLPVLPFYCFYALLQLFAVSVGYLNLLTLRFLGRRLYADHYDPHPVIAAVPSIMGGAR